MSSTKQHHNNYVNFTTATNGLASNLKFAKNFLNYVPNKVDIELLTETTDRIVASHFNDQFTRFILPKLTPYYSLTKNTLNPHDYYNLNEIIQEIKTFKQNYNRGNELTKFYHAITRLEQFQVDGLNNPDPNIRAYYQEHNLINEIFSNRNITEESPSTAINLLDPDFTSLYIDRTTVLSNINTNIDKKQDQSLNQLAEYYYVNTDIIIDFIKLIGLTLNDFKINNNLLYLTPTFNNKLKQYLKH